MTADPLNSKALHGAPCEDSSATTTSGSNSYELREFNDSSNNVQADKISPQKESMLGSGISIAVDPVALITTECITVTSAMRKHARWAQSSVSAILGGGGALDSARNHRVPEHLRRGTMHSKSSSQSSRPGSAYLDEEDGLTSRWGLRGKKGRSMQDNPLMSAFARLRSDLRGCHSMLLETQPPFWILTVIKT